MSDGVDDLEVAFDGDDYEADLFRRQSNHRQNCTFEETANKALCNLVLVVVSEAVCDHGNVGGHGENTREEIHHRLVGDQGVDAAAELLASANQNSEND